MRSNSRPLPLNAFFFSVATLLYTPLLVMYLSQTPGRFTLASLAGPVTACLTVLAVAVVLWRRWRRGMETLDAFVLGPALYVLLAATFFPVHGNVLDGSDSSVSTWDRLLHDALLGVCLAAALFSFARPRLEEVLRRATRVLGLFALAASVYMAASILPWRAGPDAHIYAAALSPKQNVIVVMLDMLEGGFGLEYFRRHPEAEGGFPGFAFYRNTASFAPFTALSYAGFMTGGYPGTDQLHDNSVRDTVYYRENIVDDLTDRGYSSKYFSIIPYQLSNDRVVRIPDDVGLTRKDNFFIEALTMRGRYLPYAYLPFGIKYMPWTQREFGMFSKVDARDSLEWFLQNVEVDQRIDKGFVWFHSLTTHQPIRLDAEGRFSMGLGPDDAHAEVAFVFDQLQRFVVHLQQLGVYDNSLVIVVSDHGYNILQKMKAMPADEDYALAPFGNGVYVGQYEPLLLVKRPGAHGAFAYDDAAVTLLDLRKSLLEFDAPGSAGRMEGFNFLGADKGSPNRTVPVIKFQGETFDNSSDFTSLAHWRRDTLQLPLREHYTHPAEHQAAAGVRTFPADR